MNTNIAASYRELTIPLFARFNEKKHTPFYNVGSIINKADPTIRIKQFNLAIERAAALAGERVFVADLFHSRLSDDFYYMNTTDGLHPDEDGMAFIAELVIKRIREYIERQRRT